MSETNLDVSLPALDDMLQSLLLIEEGEHEFTPEEENVRELRQFFFPVTRTCVYLNHAADGPLPRPTARTSASPPSPWSGTAPRTGWPNRSMASGLRKTCPTPA